MLVVEFGDRSYIQSDAEIKKKTTRGLWLVVKEQPWQLSGRYSSQRCWKVSRAVLPWQGYPLGYGEMLLLFSPSVVSNAVTPWTAAHQASLSFTISWSLFKLMPIELVMPSNRLILCGPFSNSCIFMIFLLVWVKIPASPAVYSMLSIELLSVSPLERKNNNF